MYADSDLLRFPLVKAMSACEDLAIPVYYILVVVFCLFEIVLYCPIVHYLTEAKLEHITNYLFLFRFWTNIFQLDSQTF